jgi:branched-chain amino acid transport system ATP-binding protein
MVGEVRSVIADVRRSFGAAVLLVEQNAGLALALAVAERGYVMQSGLIVAQGSIAELKDSRLMRDLYLGGRIGQA